MTGRAFSRCFGPIALDYFGAGPVETSGGIERWEYHELNLWLEIRGHAYGLSLVWKVPYLRATGHRVRKEE